MDQAVSESISRSQPINVNNADCDYVRR